MSGKSALKQYSDERAKLLEAALPRAAAVVLRRRVLSGVHWRGDLVVSAAEAVGDAERAGVHLDGERLDAEVIASDLTTDVAVLRVPGIRSRAGDVSPPDPLRLGNSIAVLGRCARGPCATWGSVQLEGAPWRSRRGGHIDQRLELDVRFDPAFEGAAVIDMDGAVAALAVPGPGHGVLAIPARTIETVVSKVEQSGHLPRPYLGIRLQPLWLDDQARAQLGRTSHGIAVVGGVDEGSPAAQAHIELGDLLLTLDGEPAETVNGLAQRIAGILPGQTIALEILRGGKPVVVNVQVGERPRH